MVSEVLFGNLLSLGAMVTDSLSSKQDSVKKMLFLQCVSQGFYSISSLILKGYSAVVQNVISMLRNIIAIRGIRTNVLQWTITVLAVVLGIWFNNRGLLGLLPVVANGMYTVVVFTVGDNQTALRWAFLIDMLMFVVFNFAIMNYVGCLASVITAVVTARAIYESRSGQAEHSGEVNQ
ncbi:MAG: YgjV family protein [Galactobacillus timonensis]|uniref:YgjV family protein n=1 Tax=Galactobacillus timonensis TaxID=2041840 RepID=UPI0023F10BEE|nr:YgjV family protein [Galactobacillus timonensis]MCI6067081.1 YgjV family protein [Galactobacillus timonensis]MCI6755068.1 YgjV family protein [Galactobacillus timonensis]MDD7086282.1 YgjV family protein [Galactobacillus timonensis]MDY5221947.1 YgjV family protein [Lachnospiraceae bacterium]